MLTAQEIEELLTGPDGAFRIARWTRPIVPVVFGVDDATLAVVKGAIQAVAQLAGHSVMETDPEQGANAMFFFIRDWAELRDVPDLDGLVPGISDLSQKLEESGANQYRHFRFETDGAIRAAFVFLRMDDELAEMAAEDVALAQAAQVITLWGDKAFSKTSPLARLPNNGAVVLRPEIAALIAAIYAPTMPAASNDAIQAMRLAARVGLTHDA